MAKSRSAGGPSLFQIKQKAWSLKDQFTIKNESGKDVYVVTGRAVSLVDQLRFCDLKGTELAFLKQKVIAAAPTFRISRPGQPDAVIKRAAFSIKPKLKLEIAGESPIEIKGKLSGYEYEFKRSGAPVAHVSQKWFSIADTYGVAITGDVDEVLILVATVAIDQINAQPVPQGRQM